MDEYAAQMKKLEKIGNIQVKPHRLAQLNEIKQQHIIMQIGIILHG